ncbi:hypothetical protein M422DRAFT_264184 [Sphaerobolus stellatus SS14]|uniref:Uncharacterized protein n=1 Tax=Sphaerobolus stellatus (strain SS14) TaxID=990650 RepID=A0A0C9TTP5_SPHS4|nr:hypothetical protein M422DRAFT_264184 [Sphaerobolus stellatus SS14]
MEIGINGSPKTDTDNIRRTLSLVREERVGLIDLMRRKFNGQLNPDEIQSTTRAMSHQMSIIHQVTAPSDNIAISTDPDNSTRNDDSNASDSNSSTASTRDTEEIDSKIWKTFIEYRQLLQAKTCARCRQTTQCTPCLLFYINSVMHNDYLFYRYSNDFRQYTQVTDPHL